VRAPPKRAIPIRQPAFFWRHRGDNDFAESSVSGPFAPRAAPNALIFFKKFGAGEGIRTLDPNLGNEDAITSELDCLIQCRHHSALPPILSGLGHPIWLCRGQPRRSVVDGASFAHELSRLTGIMAPRTSRGHLRYHLLVYEARMAGCYRTSHPGLVVRSPPASAGSLSAGNNFFPANSHSQPALQGLALRRGSR
jgi:hypothetical protein